MRKILIAKKLGKDHVLVHQLQTLAIDLFAPLIKVGTLARNQYATQLEEEKKLKKTECKIPLISTR